MTAPPETSGHPVATRTPGADLRPAYALALTEHQREHVAPRWSHSAAAKATGPCPAQWAYRNGPLHDLAPEQPLFVPRVRGNLLHDVFAYTMHVALGEVAGPAGRGLIGGDLQRWWPQARIRLGELWDEYRMPSDHAEAILCVEILRYMLRIARVPAPMDLWAMEDRLDAVTPGGRTFRYVIDFARWHRHADGRDRLRITDWKTGADDPDKIHENLQLHRYAWCAAQALGMDLARIQIELHNVRLQRTAVLDVDPDRAQRAIESVDRIADRMEAQVRTGAVLARPGGHCVTCDAATVCPALAIHQAPALSRAEGGNP